MTSKNIQQDITEIILETLHDIGYEFRLNVLNDRVELHAPYSEEWKPMSDVDEAVIFTKLRKAGIPNVNIARDTIIANAAENPYHPVKQYLNSVPLDRQGTIARLASYFTDEYGTFEIFLRRWLIGAVMRAYDSGTQNRMLVLDGPQGVGKSQFVRWLVPEKLRGKHFKEGPIVPDLKDHRIALMDTWVWEVAELGSTTRRADREALKNFITMETVSERLSYGRYAITKPALTSFIGTVNDEGGLLNDPTGSRRFMFSKLTHIDFAYAKEINIDDVWGEAVALYLEGETGELTPEEKALADRVNAEYEVIDPVEGILNENFDIDPKNTDWWTPVQVIVRVMDSEGYKGGTDAASKKIAALMTKYGVQKTKRRYNGSSNPMWGYAGVRARFLDAVE